MYFLKKQSNDSEKYKMKSKAYKLMYVLLIAILLVPYQNCGKGFQTQSYFLGGSQDGASLGIVGTRLVWETYSADEGESITGYRVYHRKNNETTATLIAQLVGDKINSVQLSELNVTLDKESSNYLQLTVYNSNNEESDPTPAVCWGKPCK